MGNAMITGQTEDSSSAKIVTGTIQTSSAASGSVNANLGGMPKLLFIGTTPNLNSPETSGQAHGYTYQGSCSLRVGSAVQTTITIALTSTGFSATNNTDPNILNKTLYYFAFM